MLQDSIDKNSYIALDFENATSNTKFISHQVSKHDLDERNNLSLKIKEMHNYIPCKQCKNTDCMLGSNTKVLKLGTFILMSVSTEDSRIFGKDIHVKPCYTFSEENRDYELVATFRMGNKSTEPEMADVAKPSIIQLQHEADACLILRAVEPKNNTLGIF
ncbi:hypothetical protein ENBRE01_1651 [Enteropsectra breve]|nr:hypothetical protein ENBRE01_0418 [Enteropsectra breve]KAI5150151.1 hypothetical protein ENBRE01_1329 [Enteropsectra breve]KAI5150693.1 hypothetical protein ENBRE01_1651 [Enteropsectra breve]